MPHSIVKYVALTGSVLVIWFYPQKEESAFADCNSPELDTSDIDDRKNIEVTVNQLVLAILFSFGMFLVHRMVRLRRTYKLYNELKDVEFLQQGGTFRGLCRQRLQDIDDIMKIHESLVAYNFKPTNKNNLQAEQDEDEQEDTITINDFTTDDGDGEEEEVEGGSEVETTSVQTDVVGDCCQLPQTQPPPSRPPLSQFNSRIKHVPPPRSIRSSSVGSRGKSFKRFTL